MSPSGQSSDAMDIRRRQHHAPERRTGPAAARAADAAAPAPEMEQLADEKAAEHGQEETASCQNGGQDGSLGPADELQLVGQEVVPAFQALVVREQKGSSEKERDRESQVETPKNGKKTQPSMSATPGVSSLKEIEDMDRSKGFHTPGHAKTHPTSFAPLFSPEQIQQWERSQAEAPMIQSQRETPIPVMAHGPVSGSAPMMANVFPWWGAGIAPSPVTPEEVSWRMQMHREMKQMGMMLRVAQHENVRLRSELLAKEEDAKSTFATPEDSKEEGARAQQESNKEEGARAQQGWFQEDGARASQAREEDKDAVPPRAGQGGQTGKRSTRRVPGPNKPHKEHLQSLRRWSS